MFLEMGDSSMISWRNFIITPELLDDMGPGGFLS